MAMSNETIQGAIDLGETIRAHCNTCQHHAVLDLIALRDRLGPDHGALHRDLAPLLRCSACGGKSIALTMTPGSNEYGGNPYTKAKDGR